MLSSSSLRFALVSILAAAQVQGKPPVPVPPTPAPPCPENPPTSGESCTFTQTCPYGTVTCCGVEIPAQEAQCINNKVVIVVPACVPDDQCECPGGGSCGDPHIQTFSGEWYDFHRTCDLVLLKTPDFGNGVGLRINIRTTGQFEYSYIETAAIQIGDDVLEVSSWGEYSFNGVGGAEMPARMATLYTVSYEEVNKKKHVLEIDLKTRNEKLVVTTFKHMVSVMVKEPTFGNFRSSVGLMGSFGNGTKLARDGVTVLDDPTAFGLEWQVRSNEPNLFQTARHPQHPQICVGPSESAKTSKTIRRLGESISIVTQEAAEQACAHWQDDHRELCVYDVMAMGDLELAEAGAF